MLGAGFGGLELATTLSESLGDQSDVTVIDKADAFVFGYSKLDVMFEPRGPRGRLGDGFRRLGVLASRVRWEQFDIR